MQCKRSSPQSRHVDANVDSNSPENTGTFPSSSGSSASIGPATSSPAEGGTATSCTDSKLVVQWGGPSWIGDSCERISEACFGVGLLGRGLSAVEAWSGVGLVGRSGVGVPLPEA